MLISLCVTNKEIKTIHAQGAIRDQLYISKRGTEKCRLREHWTSLPDTVLLHIFICYTREQELFLYKSLEQLIYGSQGWSHLDNIKAQMCLTLVIERIASGDILECSNPCND